MFHLHSCQLIYHKTRYWVSILCSVPVYSQPSLVLIVPSHKGMARQSLAGWLTTYQGSLLIQVLNE